MEGKLLYCVGQHFKSFHEQCKKEEVADFGKPCETCALLKDCSYNETWVKASQQLQKETGIVINHRL